MKKRYVLQIINGLDSVNEIRRLDKKIIEEFEEKRKNQIKPLSDSLDQYKYDIQDELIETLEKPLREIINALGLAHAKDEVKDSVKKGVTFTLMELMEQYLLNGAIELDDDTREQLIKVLKEDKE